VRETIAVVREPNWRAGSPVGEGVQLGLLVEGETEIFHPLQQSLAHPRQRLVAEIRDAGLLQGLGSEIGMRRHVGTLEVAAVASVEITLRRQPFGENDVVRGKLDVPVIDLGDGRLANVGAIDEPDRLHEPSVDIKPVSRAHHEIARGRAFA
jgi:hypothetical protein